MKQNITYREIITSDPYYNKMLYLRRERIWIPKRMMLPETFEEDEAKAIFFGAFYNSRRLVGCVMLVPDKINKWTLLRQLAVEEKYCSLGIGRHLIKIAEDYVKTNLMANIVMFPDEASKPYFEKLGYQAVSGWYTHSNGFRSIMMRKTENKNY